MHVLKPKRFMKTSRVLIEKVYNFTTSKWGKHENEKREKKSTQKLARKRRDKHRKSRTAQNEGVKINANTYFKQIKFSNK